MKLMINTSHQRFGGAVQVALSFIIECRNFPEHEYFVMLGPGLQKLVNQEEFSENFHFESFNFGPINLRKSFAINRAMQAMEAKYKPEVIISTTGPTYFHSKAPQIIGYNLGIYIYPESPHVQSWSLFQKLKMQLKKMAHFYFFRRDVTAHVVQTDDVNQRVRKALRTEEVHTVTNTHNHFYDDWETFPPKLIPKRKGVFRFVTISSWYPHKNLDLIPKVQIELRKRGMTNIEFVLTLEPEDFEKKVLKGNKVSGIHNIGPIKPAECPSLYQECDALFMPTLAECFSASYPEAMKMEKPIITTDLGFARSICEEAALYFKPMHARSAADVIQTLLTDDVLYKSLVENGKRQLEQFDTPQARVRKYLALCERMAGEHTNRSW